MSTEEHTSAFSGVLQGVIDLVKGILVTVVNIFTGPPRFVWGLLFLVVALLCLALYVSRRWVEAKPNQWLLLLRNGKFVKAGVGLKVFKTPLDTIVTFPSKVERVYFSANNVTVEMQGIIIEGFAFWSVFRDDDGPFRCYKYIQGCDANDSVRALCQGVLRNLIANSTIDEVMKNRNHLRVNMLKQLKDQFKGWGIWLESVQITDVRISSQKLFKDLQAEFRQQTRLKAELIEINGNERMQETRQTSQLKMFQKSQLNDTRKLQTNYEQDIKRRIQQDTYLNGKVNLDIEKMKRDRDLQLQRIVNDRQKAIQQLQNTQKIQLQQQLFDLERKKQQLQLDRSYDEKAMRKYKIDATQKIYQNLGVKQLKLNKYANDSSLFGVFPTLNELQKQE